MARKKSSAYYEKKAADAKARETYYRTRPARPRAGNTIEVQNTETYIYRSLFRKWLNSAGDQTSNEHFPYLIEVDADALSKIGGAGPCGLLGVNSTSINTSLAQRMRGSGIKATRAKWYNGAGTPVVETTAYNTKWVRYYDKDTATTQTHFSVPLTQAAGGFTAQDMIDQFKRIFAGGSKTTLLGGKNGRAELTLEYMTSAFSVTT